MSAAHDLIDHYKAVRARLRADMKPKPVDRVNIIAMIRYAEPIGPIMPPSIAEERTYQKAHEDYTKKLREFVAAQQALQGVEAFPVIITTRSKAQRILDDVCLAHSVTEEQICSDQRAAPIVAARFEAYYRMRRETTWSLSQIGRFLGGKDHSSVFHGVRKHAAKHGLPL